MMESIAVGGQTKTIIQSLIADGRSPEQILESLNSYGIDWYVTERGDLLIKYWQIAAEEFVPKQQVATIRENQTVPRESQSLEWLSSHLADIKREYINRWVAIKDQTIIAAAENLTDLLQLVQDSHLENPFVTFIPGEPVVWTTAYGNENI